MELLCVPLLVGILVYFIYAFAHQRGYNRGYQDAISLFAIMEAQKREQFDRIWYGTGEEEKFEGISHMVPEDNEEL